MLQAEIVEKLSNKFHASDQFIQNLLYLIEVNSNKYIPKKIDIKIRDEKIVSS